MCRRLAVSRVDWLQISILYNLKKVERTLRSLLREQQPEETQATDALNAGIEIAKFAGAIGKGLRHVNAASTACGHS